ncbi:MAG: ClpXP protease specificity-enhancing factor [Gammaproteobacteria bacterium]|nr:ClpXP protease specificity-enhancing factor [Gammaproteobacteria bacterium]
MSSAKPYLIRAIYEWIADNDYTPYISVDTSYSNVDVPKQYIKNDSITLNISPISALKLLIDNEAITFQARFGGVPHNIYIPISAVIAIYTPENGQGMAFPKEEFPDNEFTSEEVKAEKKAKTPFTIISGGKEST